VKILITYLFVLSALISRCQQTPNYVQFIFNKSGINPAASGTNINQKYYFTFGANRQWIDMDNAPKQTFGNFSYTIRPPRSYTYWQNIGGMIERDQSGAMTNAGYYINYTIHLILRKNLVTSFGVYAGVRQFFLSTNMIDPNDPVLQRSNYKTLAYPDIIPGLRLSNKKFFFDIVARQITIFSQQDYRGNQIGGPSRLNPAIFAAYGKVFPVNDYCTLLPSVALNTAIIGIPTINTNIMLYYANRFGIGLSSRNASFIGAIFQVRMLQNLCAGFSYSYSVNKISSVAPNSFEVMIGIVPMGLDGKFKGGRSVARCPALDF
jgi:type IX secretion system PorP/SprF family membrane protein